MEGCGSRIALGTLNELIYVGQFIWQINTYGVTCAPGAWSSSYVQNCKITCTCTSHTWSDLNLTTPYKVFIVFTVWQRRKPSLETLVHGPRYRAGIWSSWFWTHPHPSAFLVEPKFGQLVHPPAWSQCVRHMNFTFTCKGEEAFVPLDLVLPLEVCWWDLGRNFITSKGEIQEYFPLFPPHIITSGCDI